MFSKKFPKITDYPIKASEYKEREKAYSSKWQIRFFFIGVLAATTFFLPTLITQYFLKIDFDRFTLQGIGIILAMSVMLLSRKSRRALAKEYGLFCPECGEIFDYWSDKKNAVSFGGVCPKCNFKISDIQDTDKEK